VSATHAPAMSPADIAAHAAASYVRRPKVIALHPGDSDPNPDEALRRVREHGLSPRGLAALHRLETAVAPILRDRQTSDAARREIAEVA